MQRPKARCTRYPSWVSGDTGQPGEQLGSATLDQGHPVRAGLGLSGQGGGKRPHDSCRPYSCRASGRTRRQAPRVGMAAAPGPTAGSRSCHWQGIPVVVPRQHTGPRGQHGTGWGHPITHRMAGAEGWQSWTKDNPAARLPPPPVGVRASLYTGAPASCGLRDPHGAQELSGNTRSGDTKPKLGTPSGMAKPKVPQPQQPPSLPLAVDGRAWQTQCSRPSWLLVVDPSC